MIGNALSGLILAAPAPTASTSSEKPSSRSFDDSFSGIFREKLREASSKPSRRADTAVLKSPLKSALNDLSGQDQNRIGRRSPESGKTTAAPDGIARRIYRGKDRIDQTVEAVEEVKDDQSTAEEASDMVNLAAAALEGLFEELWKAVESLGDQAPAAVESDAGNRFEAIKGLLEGKIENLMDLIGKIVPDERKTEISGLIDDLRDILARVEELMRPNTAGDKAVMIVETGDAVDYASLIARLHAQAREIMDKLRVRFSDAAEPGGPTFAESLSRPEARTDSMAKPLAAETEEEPEAAAPESKAEPMRRIDGEQASTPEPGTENVHGRSQAPEQNVNPDMAAQKSEVTAAKPRTVEFRLSEKPLAQSVTNQVTMRLKLMAGVNRQEMEVQLKPESLGKLTIRIIHQRGEILAKITAENDQVKSILESNMQLLKDSLEKSGLTVQSLNVSVGSDNGGGRTQDDETGREGARETGISKADGRDGKKTAALSGRDMPDETHSIDLSA